MSIKQSSGWREHESDHITRSQYNPMDHTLDIEFLNGSQYRYHGVPPREDQAFTDADSQGEYHAQNIKSNYAVKRIK